MLPVPPSCAWIATRLVSKNLFRFTSPRYTLCTLSGSEAGRRAGLSSLAWHHLVCIGTPGARTGHRPARNSRI